jgi:hypothetical protein
MNMEGGFNTPEENKRETEQREEEIDACMQLIEENASEWYSPEFIKEHGEYIKGEIQAAINEATVGMVLIDSLPLHEEIDRPSVGNETILAFVPKLEKFVNVAGPIFPDANGEILAKLIHFPENR